jgi:hypothetical protein
VNTATDINHCGGCGHACSAANATASCVQGQCNVTCASGLSLCDQTCVNVASNANHCGGCGNVCKTDKVCVDGKCKNPAAAKSSSLPDTEGNGKGNGQGKDKGDDEAGNGRSGDGKGNPLQRHVVPSRYAAAQERGCGEVC